MITFARKKLHIVVDCTSEQAEALELTTLIKDALGEHNIKAEFDGSSECRRICDLTLEDEVELSKITDFFNALSAKTGHIIMVVPEKDIQYGQTFKHIDPSHLITDAQNSAIFFVHPPQAP